MTPYPYTVALVNSDQLKAILVASSLSAQFSYIEWTAPNQLIIWMINPLSAPDEVILNNIISSYVYEAPAATPIISFSVPLVVNDGETYSVSDNTQVPFSNDLVIEGNGLVLLTGDSVLTKVN